MEKRHVDEVYEWHFQEWMRWRVVFCEELRNSQVEKPALEVPGAHS
jgi:hypothetical protein